MTEAIAIITPALTFVKEKARIYLAGGRKSAAAETLVEVMITIVVLSVTVIGVGGYSYYATLDMQWADRQVTAARVGNLLCQSWASVKGAETYDLIADVGSDLVIANLSPPQSLPEGFILLGIYNITVDGVGFKAMLSWKDISNELRALHIEVTYARHDWNNPVKKGFRLITYVLK